MSDRSYRSERTEILIKKKESEVNFKSKMYIKIGPSGVQITNYKTGIFSISVLSGYETGEKDKIRREFFLFLLFCT